MRSFDTTGERAIESFLKLNHIGYAKQERWYLGEDDRYVVSDFTIRPVPENNMDSNFVGVIEFDGQPVHFKAFDAFGGFYRFFMTHNSDIEKNNFFEHLKMPFLRVRYDQINNLHEILEDICNNHDEYIKKHTKDEWYPGIFAGVMMNTEDHCLEPLDFNKGKGYERKGRMNVLRDRHIDNIIKAYEEYSNKEEYAAIVNLEQIANRKFSLNVKTYVRDIKE